MSLRFAISLELWKNFMGGSKGSYYYEKIRICGVTKPVRNFGTYFHTVSNNLFIFLLFRKSEQYLMYKYKYNTFTCVYRVERVRTCDSPFYHNTYAT